jgi:hypothetical protein
VDRRLRVSENRVLNRIFGPKRDEVTGKWRKVHEELMDPLLIKYLSDQMKKNEMDGSYSMYEREERCIQGFG